MDFVHLKALVQMMKDCAFCDAVISHRGGSQYDTLHLLALIEGGKFNDNAVNPAVVFSHDGCALFEVAVYINEEDPKVIDLNFRYL